jgi:hypothetical protein
MIITGNFQVAVIHMLVPDEDRADFYRFIRDQLSDTGVALICSMGNGITERQSDLRFAFELQKRTHDESGQSLMLAGTSCRMVSFPSFESEMRGHGLKILKTGMTRIETVFSEIMYAVVGKEPASR